jgi:glycerophosphoryl diester phosphodiesterase
VIVSAHDGYPRWVDSGADFIEVDIRRDHRRKIVLAHDEATWWKRYVTIDELLHRVSPDVGLQLDVKESGFEGELMHKVLARWSPEKIVVTPEPAVSAEAIKAEFPQVRVRPFDLITMEVRDATDEALGSATRPVWVWTVDDERQMQRLILGGRVEGIITNRPDLALRLRTAR